MKTKIFISLLVVGLSFLPAISRSQNRPDSPEEAAAAREVEAQQSFGAQVQRNQVQSANQQSQAEGESKRANTMFQDRLRALVRRESGSPGQSMITRFSTVLQGLVIRSSEQDPKEQAGLEEDLAVMSHLLEKSVGSSLQPQGGPVLGVNLVFAPGHNPSRGLYLEGYGALFTLSVGFPLLPSPKNDEEKENPSTDSAWNESRQELFGQRREGKAGYVRGEEYDERKVNKLKDSVLEALKNATHIRGLKPDDSIMVCVFGGQSVMGKGTDEQIRQELADLRKQEAELHTHYTDSHPSILMERNKIEALELQLATKQPRSTMLTIRVKKSDVDSFVQDKLNLDGFREKAIITSYAGGPDSLSGGFVGGGGGFGGGGNIGGGNTFGGGGNY